MDNERSPLRDEKDPVTELYDVASALRFLEDALEGHDETGALVRASGAAYVTGLMGRRVNAIACTLWDKETDQQPLPPAVRTADEPERD